MKKDGRKLRSESTTDHILNTAIRIARKGNIDNMSFNSIAKEAKIGTRTIFRHFKDQETLQENLDMKLGEEFSSAFAKINIEDNLEKRIENLSTILIKLYSKNQNIIRWSLRNIWRDKNLRKNMFSWNKILRNFVFSILPEILEKKKPENKRNFRPKYKEVFKQKLRSSFNIFYNSINYFRIKLFWNFMPYSIHDHLCRIFNTICQSYSMIQG